MKLEERKPSKITSLFCKIACCFSKDKKRVSNRKARTKLSKVLYNKQEQDKATLSKGCRASCLSYRKKTNDQEISTPVMSIKHRVSLKDRLDSTKDRKERTNSKISPILQRKKTKNSSNSTMGTMQIETKGLSSPYLKQFVSNNLGQLKNFPGAGEVEYKYMANEDGSQSNHSESKQERLTGKMSRMQKSASVSLRTTNKHSSFQDNNLLIPSSIQEDDMEDTLRSASPNIFENNGHSKLAEWRTQKNISLDEYNEFSEH